MKHRRNTFGRQPDGALGSDSGYDGDSWGSARRDSALTLRARAPRLSRQVTQQCIKRSKKGIHVEQIVRYRTTDTTAVGVYDGDVIRRLPGVTSMAQLLRLDRAQFRQLVATATTEIEEGAQVLPPIDGLTEVWGGGVTYDRSRVARIEESESADVYERVYRAERPELFFKSPGWRVRTNGDPIAIRRDSILNVPEPELALWVNAEGETLGFLVCNDMTSRSIEADNPLYLPQAKLYTDSCAISTGVVPFWAVESPDTLAITMSIERGSTSVWDGATSTADMARSFDELVRWLFADTDFPDGVILATGTGIVPELDFVVEPGDVVTIEIDQVGRLSNTVARRDAV